jgi:hypothetical protein
MKFYALSDLPHPIPNLLSILIGYRSQRPAFFVLRF